MSYREKNIIISIHFYLGRCYKLVTFCFNYKMSIRNSDKSSACALKSGMSVSFQSRVAAFNKSCRDIQIDHVVDICQNIYTYKKSPKRKT
jgi:hypothetical protein